MKLESTRVIYMAFCCCASLAAQGTVDQAWNVLAQGLADRSVENRSKAVHALGLISGNVKAQSLAEKALGDEGPPVRAAAAEALGAMGAKAAIPPSFSPL